MKQDAMVQTVQSMIAAQSCYEGLKKVGQAWLDAVGTDTEAAAWEALVKEAKADIITVNQLIAFTASPDGIALFGSELAEQLHTHALDIKSKGATYCDCPACAGALAVINA